MKILITDIMKFEKLISKAQDEGKRYIHADIMAKDPEGFTFLDKRGFCRYLYELGDDFTSGKFFKCKTMQSTLKGIRCGRLPKDPYLVVEKDHSVLLDIEGLYHLHRAAEKFKKSFMPGRLKGADILSMSSRKREVINKTMDMLSHLRGGVELIVKIWENHAPTGFPLPKVFLKRQKRKHDSPKYRIQQTDFKTYVDVRFKR